MERLTLRPGRPADHAFVLDLGRRTSVDSVSALRDPERGAVERSYEQLAAFVFERSHVLIVAESDLDGPVGFLLLLGDLPDEVSGMPQGFVAYMAVEAFARRRGVGARLLAAAEDEARERRLPFMALMVTEENAAARELYAQAGYQTERRLMCKPL